MSPNRTAEEGGNQTTSGDRQELTASPTDQADPDSDVVASTQVHPIVTEEQYAGNDVQRTGMPSKKPEDSRFITVNPGKWSCPAVHSVLLREIDLSSESAQQGPLYSC